ncbi:MAG: sugar phosphate isomerase/epimerase family protein, partial [Pirellulaceae bacterium]
VRGQKLAFDEQVELTASAGYDAIEPWIRDVQAFVDNGGNLDKVKSRIEQLGITVESAIGFANWIVDDDKKRAEGLETARRDMKLVKAIGGTRIAAPPVGATNQEDLDLFKAAARYRDLLDVGKEEGVTPQLELWGFSKSISRLGELMFVAVESGHPDACMLLDIYHIYKGGSDFQGLELINSSRVHVFHVNDYPADPPRETISDADRVHMGDGVAPTSMILQTIYKNGFRGMLSLELFNRTYWEQDALEVARTGLEKMKASVRKAMA